MEMIEVQEEAPHQPGVITGNTSTANVDSETPEGPLSFLHVNEHPPLMSNGIEQWKFKDVFEQ